ncbi:hypothetical protein MTO96_014984 [Rhipicephalus appendiculatus]
MGRGEGAGGSAPSVPTLTTNSSESVVGARRDGPASERADHRVAIIIAVVEARGRARVVKGHAALLEARGGGGRGVSVAGRHCSALVRNAALMMRTLAWLPAETLSH